MVAVPGPFNAGHDDVDIDGDAAGDDDHGDNDFDDDDDGDDADDDDADCDKYGRGW